MTQLSNDQYGRGVDVTTDGITDTYSVSVNAIVMFSIGVPAGTDVSDVYAKINSQAPGGTVTVEKIKAMRDSYRSGGQDLVNQMILSAINAGGTPTMLAGLYAYVKDFLIACELGHLEAAYLMVNVIQNQPPFITDDVKTQTRAALLSIMGKTPADFA